MVGGVRVAGGDAFSYVIRVLSLHLERRTPSRLTEGRAFLYTPRVHNSSFVGMSVSRLSAATVGFSAGVAQGSYER